MRIQQRWLSIQIHSYTARLVGLCGLIDCDYSRGSVAVILVTVRAVLAQCSNGWQ